MRHISITQITDPRLMHTLVVTDRAFLYCGVEYQARVTQVKIPGSNIALVIMAEDRDPGGKNGDLLMILQLPAGDNYLFRVAKNVADMLESRAPVVAVWLCNTARVTSL